MIKIFKQLMITVIIIAPATDVWAVSNDQNRCFPESLKMLAQLPMPKNQESLITVSERIFTPTSVNEVYRKFEALPLNQLMTETEGVSGVDFTYALIGEQYLVKGDKRAVCLMDGYGAIEELLENTRPHRFAYRVWNFSLPEAESISYGDGEFLFKPLESGTEIIWNYKFALKKDEFPGNLGGLGRWLFKKSFAESTWKKYMHQALSNFKKVVDS